MYELGLSSLKLCTISEESLAQLKRSIVAGLSRTLLRMGDISKGMRLIANVTDPSFLHECVTILESLKQYTEAASILEKIGKWNNAAQIWVKGTVSIFHHKAKSWDHIGSILDKITNISVLSQYAHAKESIFDYIC